MTYEPSKEIPVDSPYPTQSDILAAAAFLSDRSLSLARDSDFRSEAYRVPTAMEFLVQQLVADLLTDLATHSGKPLPEDAVRRWNCLADALGPWEDQPGYDKVRLRRIPSRPDAGNTRT
ncbi:hypothetical protein [Kitasatospora sp. NPDC002965]|uniref:hypothetical protein n=1 Tax=Kitasatospora sp. NPDC002965 TaxID=3154775 RepID=UPI0033BA10AE